MAGAPFHGWLMTADGNGTFHEIINQARTAKYLANPSLALNNVSICDILAFGGCETYAYGPERVVASGGHADLPTGTGNYMWIPSGGVPTEAIPSGTGDISVIAHIAPDDWTPSASRTIVSRWNQTGNQRGWYLYLSPAGALIWNWSTDGSNNLLATSTANLGALANGEKRWVAATFDVDNGAGGRTVTFWQSTDGSGWTLLGTPVTSATPTAIFPTTANVMIGAQNTGSTGNFPGNIYDVQIRNGVAFGGGPLPTTVFHFDGDIDLVGITPSGPTILASTGQTMTVVRAGATGIQLVAPTYRCDLVSQVITDPISDPAPWYNANYPESADALGFYVDEWTGLDDGHIRRNSVNTGSLGGGAQLGPVWAEGRTMGLNLMLFARSEQAMEYLFRWLSSTLNSVCSTCATDTMLIRRFCGTTADPWNGVAELRNVGIAAGLRWESEIGRRARCYIRRASFTMIAGDPCMYSPNEAVPDSAQNYDANLPGYFTAKPPDPTRTICRPSCSEVTTLGRLSRTFSVEPLGAMAPVVTWTNSSATNPTFPFRAIVYFGEHETDAPSPCGMPILGELYVRPLPPSSAMRWDIAGRRVEFKDSTTSGWVDSWAYVDANDPPQRRFFALPCGQAHLVMEPASMCATFVSGTTYTLDGLTFNPPAYPTVAIEMSERLSCP